MEGGAKTREDAGGCQRMAAGLEKIGIGFDIVEFQDMAPDIGDDCFGGRGRRDGAKEGLGGPPTLVTPELG